MVDLTWFQMFLNTAIFIMADWRNEAIMITISLVLTVVFAYRNNLTQRRANTMSALMILSAIGWYALVAFVMKDIPEYTRSFQIVVLTSILCFFVALSFQTALIIVKLQSNPKYILLMGLANKLQSTVDALKERAVDAAHETKIEASASVVERVINDRACSSH